MNKDVFDVHIAGMCSNELTNACELDNEIVRECMYCVVWFMCVLNKGI